MPSKKITTVTKASKTVKKPAKTVMPKKVLDKKSKKTKPARPQPLTEKSTGLTVRVFDTTGKVTGSIKLPEKTFGAKINKNLLAQALYVYAANATSHTANTKTRGEVRGGGKKPWRQKGTGNARAGSKRSPLWVGGGIVFGPKNRNTKLDLPKKMKKSALISALSQKAKDGDIKVIANLEKISPKTKIMANLFSKIDAKSSNLLVLSGKSKNTSLASRNISQTSLEVVNNLNAYIIMKNRNILISKDAMEKFI